MISKHKALKLVLLITMVMVASGFTVSKEYGLIKSKVISKIKIPKWYHEGLYLNGKYIYLNNGKNGDTWVIDTDTRKIINKIKPIGEFTEAITLKEPGVFFATDWDAEKVYISKIEDNVMQAISEKSVGPAHPAGASWNGTNLFVITWARSLSGTKFYLLKMDADMNILSTAQIGRILEPCHMAWDGKYMWISCWYANRIYKVDAEKPEILGYIKSPAKKTTGIACDGKYMWVTGTHDNLYKLEIQN